VVGLLQLVMGITTYLCSPVEDINHGT
jgi:hypothetical protein